MTGTLLGEPGIQQRALISDRSIINSEVKQTKREGRRGMHAHEETILIKPKGE